MFFESTKDIPLEANPVRKVVTISKSKKFREKHGKILLEGRRLISDALEAGAVLETLFFSSVDSLTDFPAEKLKRANLVKVKFEDIKTWSDLVTPQGIIAIFNVPNYAQMKYPELCIKNCLPLSVICDNIRDPGNLGTILRCAAGAGCDKVLLTKGCVDVWEPKVLRAGMGAHFRIPLIANLEWESIPNYLSTSCKVFAADHHGLATLDQDVSSSGRDKDYGWVSSRQNPKVNQYKEWSSSDDDSDLEERKPTAKFHLPDVGIQCYHDLWAQGQTAVVIGGEAHGLSMEALELAESTAGQRLYIPLVPGMDSLNSGMAASILLFEAKRQLTLLKK
ncbi:rRNA methyltransferase 3, mitochondrial isoform X2 [Protopterus annectens]|uniref:rRNA methyltransferase 3, mitochondrial isoform X2 n=1 Tax=Protopterus annectens TaxID=7888 RepID=UPI001CFC2F85|nr:rRNA methyltransferase 3, mitochondrial isoform X2 [Protopterus annectens]